MGGMDGEGDAVEFDDAGGVEVVEVAGAAGVGIAPSVVAGEASLFHP